MMFATNFQLSKKLPAITLVAHNGKLIALDWHTQKSQKILDKANQQINYVKKDDLDHINDNVNAQILKQTIDELKAYISGQQRNFTIPLDLSTGTAFQQKVWGALLEIPYGQTISYAQLANNIGQPTAYRAVANANGRNPISLIIPCHRVIASNGNLGGYTGGITIKQALLDIEKTNKNT